MWRTSEGEVWRRSEGEEWRRSEGEEWRRSEGEVRSSEGEGWRRSEGEVYAWPWPLGNKIHGVGGTWHDCTATRGREVIVKGWVPVYFSPPDWSIFSGLQILYLWVEEEEEEDRRRVYTVQFYYLVDSLFLFLSRNVLVPGQDKLSSWPRSVEFLARGN